MVRHITALMHWSCVMWAKTCLLMSLALLWYLTQLCHMAHKGKEKKSGRKRARSSDNDIPDPDTSGSGPTFTSEEEKGGMAYCSLLCYSASTDFVEPFTVHVLLYQTHSPKNCRWRCRVVSWPAGNNLRKIHLVMLGSILGLFYLWRVIWPCPIKLVIIEAM